MKKGVISICIPAHDMGGENIKMLTQLLESIKWQTYQKIEIIVSDQSSDNKLQKVCSKYKDVMKVKWVDNRKGTRASAANVNNAILNSIGEYIKPLFLDDLFNENQALEIMINMLQDKAWIVTACEHYTEDINNKFRPHRPQIPDYNRTEKENMQSLALGENLIGNPSVIMYRRCECFFDNHLRMLMDTDLYYRLYLKFRLPVFENTMLMLIRIHKNSQQQLCSKELIDIEKRYMRAKFEVLELKKVD